LTLSDIIFGQLQNRGNMSTKTQRVLISCLVIGLAALLCAGVISLGTAGYFILFPKTNQPQISSTPFTGVTTPFTGVTTPFTGVTTPFTSVTTPIAGGTPSQATRVAPTLAPSGTSPTATATYAPVSPDIAREMDQIQQQVSQIRGLQAHEPVTRVLITPAQLVQRITIDFAQQNDPKDIQVMKSELVALGLIKPDFDLYDYLERLQTEEVAGFYDDKTKQMFVVSGEGFGGNEKWTYSHEYTHALQDQNFDIEHGLNYNDQACKTQSERCSAIQALLEGDASLTAFDWVTHDATPQDILQIEQFANSLKLPVYDQAPDYMKQDFNFPYQQGQDFVQYLYNKGGWAAVDQAYKNPPDSTAQILHPQLYPDQQPVTVTLPDLGSALGAGWTELEQNSLGEWYTYLMLAHGIDPKTRLDDNTAKTAAQGWAGDTYQAYSNGKSSGIVFVLATVWDSATDAQQFATAFKTYSNNRFGMPSVVDANTSTWSSGGACTEFNISGNRTTWIYAPDAATEQAIWKIL
jgi:hypothetical protein